MNKLAVARCSLLVTILATMLAHAQDTPPATVESPGVCPFECCTFREWTADKDVPVYATRDEQSRVVFHVRPDEAVDGLTGVVVTEHPAAIVIDHALRDGYVKGNGEPQLSLRPGDTAYLLTPLGEGAYLFWYKGKVYEAHGHEMQSLGGVDGKGMTLTWWQQVRNKAGQTGWARDGQFRNIDACG